MKVKIRKIEIRYISYEDWIPIQGNLKDLHTKNFKKLKKSFQEKDGFVPAFIWIPNKNETIELPDGSKQEIKKGKPHILDGHQRHRLFTKEKFIFIDEETGKESKEYGCLIVRADNLKDAKERLLVIASQFGTVTQEGHYEFTLDLDDEWVEETTNFDVVFSTDSEEAKAKEDEGPGDPPEEPVTVTGDLYELVSVASGITHRIQCGDSTASIPDGDYTFIFNDVPFGDDSILFPSYDLCKSKTALQFWICSDKQSVALASQYNKDFSRFFIHDFKIPTLISNKREMQLHAIISMFGKGEFFNQKKGFSSIVRVASERTIKKETGTPMSKRVALPYAFIEHFSKKGDLIGDFFLHSGSTLIACEQLGRICYGQELDPKYMDVIVKRWAKYMQGEGLEYKILRNGEECKDFATAIAEAV